MKYIYIGKIVNTHGIKGEIRLLSNFKYKEKVFKKEMTIYIGKDKIKETINSYRHHKQFEMITLNGYTNINEVLKYMKEKVYINEEDLILEKDEYLDSDLLNLEVYTNNKYVGKIERIEDYKTYKLIIVKNEEKNFIIPYVNDIIEQIDFKEKKIVIKYIKGLLD